MSDVRQDNLREANVLISGPTFQFGTDFNHPIGGAVTMFAACSVRASDGALNLALPPAPRYGKHTREILEELGISADDMISTGVASEGWSGSYLPGFRPTLPKELPMCPVCLESRPDPSATVELACGHVLCRICATRCSRAGHGNCPVCRHRHILDPECLAQRSAEWRQQYAGWRSGEGTGAAGEIFAIRDPTIKKGITEETWIRSAGDLVVAKKRLFPLVRCEV
mmetsp:Transcript_68999/g.122032  ORF Transcript_68999/g.122032 Transcript_68999/m.122032 type:complete len:225 (+) Transcript_68999:2431-3105(+)